MLRVFRQQHIQSELDLGAGEDSRHLSRLTQNAGLILASMTLGALVFWSWGGALSILIGGAIALLNFSWMLRAVDQILGVGLVAGTRIKVGRFLAGFLGRLILILVGLFAIIYLSFLSLLGALMGLSIFVLAGFLEAILLVLRRQGTS